MVRQRHPDVAALMVRALSSAEEGRHLQAADLAGCSSSVLEGLFHQRVAEARPHFLANVDGNEPGVPARG